MKKFITRFSFVFACTAFLALGVEAQTSTTIVDGSKMKAGISVKKAVTSTPSTTAIISVAKPSLPDGVGKTASNTIATPKTKAQLQSELKEVQQKIALNPNNLALIEYVKNLKNKINK